jgi:hypothetical protein
MLQSIKATTKKHRLKTQQHQPLKHKLQIAVAFYPPLPLDITTMELLKKKSSAQNIDCTLSTATNILFSTDWEKEMMGCPPELFGC